MFEPIVTVLMPVYNGGAYISQAIDSVLSQTFHNFEFLIIDDGSTDNSIAVSSSYPDGRIRILKNDKNLGISKALNIGIQNARGKYIARMDCDDVNAAERFYKQVLFMEQHPEIGVCGCWVNAIDEMGKGHLWRFPIEPEQIKCQLLFCNTMAHPSVMLRRDTLEKTGIYYDALFQYAQDYKLWVELAKKIVLANIPEVLVAYRLHSHQLSAKNWCETVSEPDTIKREQLQLLGIVPTKEEMEIHRQLTNANLMVTKEFVQKAGIWLSKIEQANHFAGCYPRIPFAQVVNDYRGKIGLVGD